MQIVTIRNGNSVAKLSEPIFMLEKLVYLRRRLEPLVMTPRPSHWKTARMISAKPSVAIAR